MENIQFWQWVLVIGSSLILFFISPLATTTAEFFKANTKGKSPNWILLTGSLVISWVFAKSIANAAILGNKFGMVGGVAYGTYYLSFIIGGIVIYYLRKKGGFSSIHHFLNFKFGRQAIVLFSIVVAFRLFNEVWSNTMVIGSYFGDQGSTPYYSSIIVFTALTLAYALKGGLKSSIFSDLIQMALFAILLSVILGILFGKKESSFTEIVTTGTFSWDNGLHLLFAAALQSFSYPFHDPVLTDRGFISSNKTTLISFILAGIIGFICIVLFSFLGIFGKLNGFAPGAIKDFGLTFGPLVLLLINFIMIVSAASTLDSTFSSFSKLLAMDLKLGDTLKFGRITMIIIAIAGTMPLFFSPEILSATTISGTMVIGLTPVFIFWWIPVPKISFFLSVGIGIMMGTLLSFDLIPKQLFLTEGPYNDLLWTNVFGILICISIYFLPLLFIQNHAKTKEISTQ
ncbi:sodium:solute symporter [Putridiphycobacter roseus]|uniref:Sodium:solute symporter n=1 Tax=Putridiphycobacter roseus TaxID=2219161 RepID=A0A2W1NHI2_9FLAO|nr:sodium:solute symporter [Putridiphycobacter roseus]